MKLYKLETDNVFFAGDMHGEFSGINVTINSYKLDNCAIVFCGDIGIGFEKEEYYSQTFKKISKTLKKKNIHCYFFRGNHDNKDYFDGEHFTDFEYIHVLKDYSVLQTPTRNILCVGGATSIDRTYRLQGMETEAIRYKRFHNCTWKEAYDKCRHFYWENEPIVFDENELVEIDGSGVKIDTICTHTAPSFCDPITKDGILGWIKIDATLEEDLAKERQTCDDILLWLVSHEHPIKNWYYGHFHKHNVEIIQDIKFTLLDMFRGKLDLC